MLNKLKNVLTIALHVLTYVLPILAKHTKKSDTTNK